MLSLNERIFLYRYLALTQERGIPYRKALLYYWKDLTYTRHKKTLYQAFLMLKKNKKIHLFDSLYTTHLVPRKEFLILSFIHTKQRSEITALFAFAEYLRKRHSIQRKLTTVCIYPLLLVIEGAVIAGIALFWLLPSFADLFHELNTPLPHSIELLTVLTAKFSSVLTAHKLLIGIAAAVIICACIYARRHIKEILYTALMHIFGFGKLIRILIVTDIFYMLSLILQNKKDAQVEEEVAIVAQVTPFSAYSRGLYALLDHLSGEKNKNISHFLHNKKQRFLFPLIVRQLCHLGFKHNTLITEIHTLSRILEEEVEIEIKHFIAVLEPVLILSIASLVLILGLTLQRMLLHIQQINAGLG